MTPFRPEPESLVAECRLLLLVVALCAMPVVAAAQPALASVPPGGWLATAATPEPAGSVTTEAPSYHDYFNALGYSFTHGLADRDQLLPLAIGTAAALAVLPVDQKVSEYFRNHGSDGAGHGLEVLGGPLVLGALSGGLVLGSLGSSDPRFRTYAFTLSQGMIVSQSLTTALKLAVRRTRPDASSQYSFPSGHATGSFALAAVTSHYYGAKAGVPLYALASLISLSRVSYGKHFPSDVIVGAAVGYISARAAISGAEHVTGDQQTREVQLGTRSVSFSLRF